VFRVRGLENVENDHDNELWMDHDLDVNDEVTFEWQQPGVDAHNFYSEDGI
jgi:hypothetical protein